MKNIEAIIRPERMEQTKVALTEGGFSGLHVESVTDRGAQRGVIHSGRGGGEYVIDMLPKVKLTIVVKDAGKALDLIMGAAQAGNIGDGKIFVTSVEEVLRVRTGERGEDVL